MQRPSPPAFRRGEVGRAREPRPPGQAIPGSLLAQVTRPRPPSSQGSVKRAGSWAVCPSGAREDGRSLAEGVHRGPSAQATGGDTVPGPPRTRPAGGHSAGEGGGWREAGDAGPPGSLSAPFPVHPTPQSTEEPLRPGGSSWRSGGRGCGAESWQHPRSSRLCPDSRAGVSNSRKRPQPGGKLQVPEPGSAREPGAGEWDGLGQGRGELGPGGLEGGPVSGAGVPCRHAGRGMKAERTWSCSPGRRGPVPLPCAHADPGSRLPSC